VIICVFPEVSPSTKNEAGTWKARADKEPSENLTGLLISIEKELFGKKIK
jgi:hypothetical protein